MTIQEKPDMSNFRLFLSFIKGDSRIPDAFRWSFSIDAKVNAVGILHEEVLLQIPKCMAEIRASEEEGVGEIVQSIILAIRYEVFLNSIYALCENLSYLVHHLHGKTVPRPFRAQRQRFLQYTELDSEYAKVLEQSKWYDEVNAMRTEATHFLSGMITISRPSQLGYFNVPKDPREGAPKEIQIADVEKHVKDVYLGVLTFLSMFGNHFVTMINQDSRVAQICYIIPRVGIGGRLISLREHLNGQPGVCQTPLFDCPNKNSCKARNK